MTQLLTWIRVYAEMESACSTTKRCALTFLYVQGYCG